MAKFVISGPDGKETEYELAAKETRIGRVAVRPELAHPDRAAVLVSQATNCCMGASYANWSCDRPLDGRQ